MQRQKARFISSWVDFDELGAFFTILCFRSETKLIIFKPIAIHFIIALQLSMEIAAMALLAVWNSHCAVCIGKQ